MCPWGGGAEPCGGNGVPKLAPLGSNGGRGAHQGRPATEKNGDLHPSAAERGGARRPRSRPHAAITVQTLTVFSYCSWVLKARMLERLAVPFSSGPQFLRSLHHDPSVLGGPRLGS